MLRLLTVGCVAAANCVAACGCVDLAVAAANPRHALGPAPASLGAAYSVDPRHPVSATELGRLGHDVFFDASLSASGRSSCATCHDPAHAFAPANALPVQLAGTDGRTPGVRGAPSLRYLQSVPPFSEHAFENEGDDSIDAGPTGGRTWDGRAASAHAQAKLPLLSPFEMGNATPTDVVAKLRSANSASRFRALWGDDIFERPADAFAAAVMALEVYQETPAAFQPFSSKYDAVLRGQARLSASEARGRAAFEDPLRGNCASCHPSEAKSDGSAPLFSDFGYVAIAVPRNRALAGNADPGYFDLGLCGPLRQDLRDHAEYCGAFRVPSLRNVATRGSFFHNGVFHDLAEAVRFYATRDTDPGRWYGRDETGRPRHFDDLPERYQGNVNRQVPFGAVAGEGPTLSEGDIRDIVAFLKTLTDADVDAAMPPPPTSAQTPTSSISR
ncbi:MAG: c-type cytochrome [Pseudomonadota bacterium]|nr:c-type cytochrome [Pseudomonadota bacterium]